MEAYQCGRSRTWYWKEVLAAVVIGIGDEIMRNPLLALRAISVGWATLFLFYYGVAPRLLGPFVRRFFLPSGAFPSVHRCWLGSHCRCSFVRRAAGSWPGFIVPIGLRWFCYSLHPSLSFNFECSLRFGSRQRIR
jgi:hypothetical protein